MKQPLKTGAILIVIWHSSFHTVNERLELVLLRLKTFITMPMGGWYHSSFIFSK